MPFGSQHQNQRTYPATAEEAFKALTQTLRSLNYKIKSTDDFTRSVSFSTPMSGFTSGQNMSAQVVDLGPSCSLRLEGTGKLATQVGNSSALSKVSMKVLDGTSRRIQANRKRGS